MTAFMQWMLGSASEVAKFEGASVKTVSGVRRIIKKAVSVGAGGMANVKGKKKGNGGNGAYGASRAAFEDKVSMSGKRLFRCASILFNVRLDSLFVYKYPPPPRMVFRPTTKILHTHYFSPPTFTTIYLYLPRPSRD
ncbi:hypothetical protein J3R30DRAFT_2101768 [Lentinula aciculospora]|uniref:Uncharacterized protein n=1 Tax=Lentinula aciculospora TaxID=153920 RepID=A0A9W9DSA5_9AGAR|nr:hypothetical protein J3R30DRAFT_2101768 [Lentinula aciculospora]